MPADRPPRGPLVRAGRRRIRRRTDPLDERRGRLDRLWGLVLRRFRDSIEQHAIEQHAENFDEEHDDRP